MNPMPEGKILLFVGKAHGPVGLIALRDTLRAETRETLERLRAQGIRRLVMTTGDRRQKAGALARELGLGAIGGVLSPVGRQRTAAQRHHHRHPLQ